jgi:DNA replication protein DnaC
MRTEEEIDNFELTLENEAQECPNDDCKVEKCACKVNIPFVVEMHRACIPNRFRNIQPEDVKANFEVFENVRRYTKKNKLAFARGCGLTLAGPNGVGKTMFASYVLSRVVYRGYSAYYTTLPQLCHNIKLGFNDFSYMRRLDEMLRADFLCIDEVGAEQTKDFENHNFMKSELLRIMKERENESSPTIILTNMFISDIYEIYGNSLGDLVKKNGVLFTLEPVDMREEHKKMIEKKFEFKSGE